MPFNSAWYFKRTRWRHDARWMPTISVGSVSCYTNPVADIVLQRDGTKQPDDVSVYTWALNSLTTKALGFQKSLNHIPNKIVLLAVRTPVDAIQR